MAAERPPAISHAAEQPGLVARTDLAQFYATLVLGAELFDQGTEIHARIRAEKEQHLVIPKRKDHRDDFHIESECLRLFPAEQQRFPLLALIGSRPHGIFLRCPAEDGLRRVLFLAAAERIIAKNHGSVFHAALCLTEHMVAAPELFFPRTIGLNGSDFAKANAYHLRHL